MNKEKVLGYDVNILTFNDALKFLITRMEQKNGTRVVTINPEIIEQAKKDTELSNIIKNAELVVADGTGIQIALKLKGIKQERIPGIDLAYNLIKQCADSGNSIALIGAKENVITKAAEKLKETFNNLNIIYLHNGYYTETDEDKIIKEITEAKPSAVFAALGAPKQEFFIEKCIKELPTAVYIGVGGSFDVWSGQVDRAPEIFQKTGCEWIYRTLKQPQRLKRIYKTLPVFLFKVIIEAVKYRVCMCRKEKND